MRGRVLPFLTWLRGYSTGDFTRDFLSGLTVAVVLVPQSMAYAMLAGLPPVVGLYASALAPAVAALWGSSPQLQTGPVAIVSLLVFTSLMPLAEPESAEFVELAIILALLVGIFQLALGIFRLGFIMNFVSHAVVTGFSNAAAIIIASTQIPHLLGVEITKHEFVFKNFVEIAKALPETHFYTAVIGLGSIAFILIARKIHPLFPGALIAVAVSTMVAGYMNLGDMGVRLVGEIPRGLPSPSLPDIDLDTIDELMGQAIVIAIIGFMEAYAIAKTMAAQTRFKLDVDQELIGQGLANLVNSFIKGYPVSGSFSRSAVNFLAGARTGISSVVTSAFVIVTLFFLADLLYNLPRAVLASIVIVAVVGIVKPKAFIELYRTNRHDGLVAIVTFGSSFIMKPDYAIFIGIVLSLILFLWRSMHPRIVLLTRDPKTRTFVNSELFGLPGCPQILFIRPDASLYFANAEHIIEEIELQVRKREESLKFVILDGESINHIDATAIDVLKEFIEDLRDKNIGVYFVNLKTPVREILSRSGVLSMVGEEAVLASKGSAIKKLFQLIDHTYCKEECPYAVFEECYSVKEFVKLKTPDQGFIKKLYTRLSKESGIKVYIGDRDSSLLISVGRRIFEFTLEDFYEDEKGRIYITPTKILTVNGRMLTIGQLARRLGFQILNGNPLLGEKPAEISEKLLSFVRKACEVGG